MGVVMKVTYTEEALRDMRRIGHVAARKIASKIMAYAADPSAFANQVKALKGAGYRRLRVGDYRVIFAEDGTVIMIIRIGHRREVYR